MTDKYSVRDALVSLGVTDGDVLLFHSSLKSFGYIEGGADAVIDGKPLIERITTVTGCVREPANLLLRVGTIFLDAIGECGGYSEKPGKIFAGGSMCGACAPDDTVPLGKGVNGIVVLNEKEAVPPETTACIRCGRCVRACPMGLNPYRLLNLCEAGDKAQAEKEETTEENLQNNA